jgi:hypothetical protein
LDDFLSFRLNRKFIKLEYRQENHPVYQNQYGQVMYLYFRSEPRPHWVISSKISELDNERDSDFSYSLGPDLQGGWQTPFTYHYCSTARFDGPRSVQRNVIVSGFNEFELDGVYERLGDQINAHPCYLKVQNENSRYLFFSVLDEKNIWMISSTDSEKGQVYARSTSSQRSGTWYKLFIPTIEFPTFTKIQTADSSNFLQTDEFFKGGELNEYLTMESLFSNTLMWKESNHECLLFSHKNQFVKILAMDFGKMKAKMNPLLIDFLTKNSIFMNELSTADLYYLLGALTEVIFVLMLKKNIYFFVVLYFHLFIYLFFFLLDFNFLSKTRKFELKRKQLHFLMRHIVLQKIICSK